MKTYGHECHGSGFGNRCGGVSIEDEKLEMLEEYEKCLEYDLERVKKRIEELKGA
jgi:hypothetical protein